MSIHNDDDLSDEQLKRATYSAAKNFFGWNSGRNTPNILSMLTKQIGELQKTIETSTKATSDELAALKNVIEEAGRSSGALARALNRITLWYAVITGVGVLCTIVQVVLAYRK